MPESTYKGFVIVFEKQRSGWAYDVVDCTDPDALTICDGDGFETQSAALQAAAKAIDKFLMEGK